MSNAPCPILQIAMAAACGAMLMTPAPAAASPVSLSHSYSLDTLIQGTSTSMVFDLTSYLFNQGFAPADVVGGSVSVFGFSDAVYGAPQAGPNFNTRTLAIGTRVLSYSYEVAPTIYCSYPAGCYVHGGYTASWSDVFVDYSQTSDREIRFTDTVADQMQVNIGASLSTGVVSLLPANVGNFGSYQADGLRTSDCVNNGCNQTFLYSRERDVYSALAGALGVTQTLDTLALLGLRSSGTVDIDFAAPVGQFRLNQVSFDLTLRQPVALLGTTGNQAHAVSEPAALPLAGLALALALSLGGLHRCARPAARSAG